MHLSQIKQNTPEWYEFRKNKIGASDAPIIMRESPWISPIQLWERKLGFAPEQEDNQAMAEGRRLEPIALRVLSETLNLDFKPAVGVHEDYPWMMASFDGLTNFNHVAAEIKCPGLTDHNLASEGIVPTKYRYQLQHQMAVAGIDMIYYFSFDKARYNLDWICQGHIIEVKRDQNLIDQMIEEELKFLECLRLCTPPELSDRDIIFRDDEAWKKAASRWAFANGHLQAYKELEAEARKELISEAQGNYVSGAGVIVRKIIRAGAVDYSQIPELQKLRDVDLNLYRKKPTESWRIMIDD